MRRLLIIGLIAILVISSFTGCVEEEPGEKTLIEYAIISISEIYYKTLSNDLDKEFIELYIWDDKGESIDFSGWYITSFDDDKEILPSISDLGNYDYISIRIGSGIDDLDASDGDATIFLDRSAEMLDDSGDEIGLYNPSEVLVDYVRYNGGNGDSVLGNWENTDIGVSAESQNESIQLIGYDHNNSLNWVSSPVSQAAPNIFDFHVAAYDLDVHIHNGINKVKEYVHSKFEGDINITVNPTHPVDNKTVERFKEYINFSLTLFDELGFNEPETGPDGDVDVELGNASSRGKTPSTGSTSIGGNITIWVGFNNVTDKWTCEHELIHAIHNKKFVGEGNKTYIRRSVERFKNEGMAEYFGVKSTMQNFGITEDQVLENASRIQGYDLDDFLKNPDINIFGDWQGTWGHYVAAYLYFKYLVSVYGEEKLLHIYRSQQNYNSPWTKDPEDVTGIDAIDKAFREQPEHNSTTFNDTFVNWTIWLWENYSEYIVLTFNETYNGTKNLTEGGRLEPWGVDFERIVIDTENGTILVFDGANNTNYSITIIRKKNGTIISTDTYGFMKSNEIEIPGDCDEIIIIKRQLDGTTGTMYNFTAKERIRPIIFPRVSFTATPMTGFASLKVQFEATATDEDGTIVQYHWAFGDGETSEEQNPWHVYSSPGTYNVILVVRDNDDALNSTSKTIIVKQRPRFSVASIQGHVTDNLYIDRIGMKVELVDGSDDVDLTTTAVELDNSEINVNLNYDSNNYFTYDFVTDNIFEQSGFDLTNEEFGLIVYTDEDGSCSQENPVMNTGDIAYITVNTTICFEGLFTDTSVTGSLLPDNGILTEISFTTPSDYDEEIIDLI